MAKELKQEELTPEQLEIQRQALELFEDESPRSSVDAARALCSVSEAVDRGFVGNIELEDPGPILDLLENECIQAAQAFPPLALPQNKRPTEEWRDNLLELIKASGADMTDGIARFLHRVLNQSQCVDNARRRLAEGNASAAAYWLGFAVWFHFEANPAELVITSAENSSKGPDATAWEGIKQRWDLSMTEAEEAAVEEMRATCP